MTWTRLTLLVRCGLNVFFCVSPCQGPSRVDTLFATSEEACMRHVVLDKWLSLMSGERPCSDQGFVEWRSRVAC